MKKKKDCLFLCQFFYPEYVSSATLPYDTAVALKNAGYSVSALCGYPYEYADSEKYPIRQNVEGIDIKRVKYVKMSRKSVIGRLVNYFSLTFMMFLHLFEIRKYHAVIVYSNPPILPWIASWSKALFGTKLIFVAYDIYPEIAIRTNTLHDKNIICRLMKHINKVVYKRADKVVTLSSEMKDFVIKNRLISSERVVCIPNWYENHEQLSKDSEKNSFQSVTKDRFVVSYFGNMGIAQDMTTIMDAIRKLKDDPDVCFLFAGHGNKQAVIKDIIVQERISNVYVYDFLQGKQFQDALQISDCALISLEKGLTGLCVPSKTYSYMMQGIPLLAIMDKCDIVNDIEEGAGLWVENGDFNRLAENIIALKNDEAMQLNMKTKCRDLFLKKYTTEVCTKKYVELFQSILCS